VARVVVFLTKRKQDSPTRSTQKENKNLQIRTIDNIVKKKSPDEKENTTETSWGENKGKVLTNTNQKEFCPTQPQTGDTVAITRKERPTCEVESGEKEKKRPTTLVQK